MSWDSVMNIFQGITTLAESFSTNPKIAVARIVLIVFGLLLIYLGKKGILEALLMIPMGLGMATVNAAIMFFDPLNLHGGMGTLFVEAQAGATADAVKNAAELMTVLQIDWLQPIYTYTFSNGLIACLVFMGRADGAFYVFASGAGTVRADCRDCLSLPGLRLWGLSVSG